MTNKCYYYVVTIIVIILIIGIEEYIPNVIIILYFPHLEYRAFLLITTGAAQGLKSTGSHRGIRKVVFSLLVLLLLVSSSTYSIPHLNTPL